MKLLVWVVYNFIDNPLWSWLNFKYFFVISMTNFLIYRSFEESVRKRITMSACRLEFIELQMFQSMDQPLLKWSWVTLNFPRFWQYKYFLDVFINANLTTAKWSNFKEIGTGLHCQHWGYNFLHSKCSNQYNILYIIYYKFIEYI